ncbi:Putative glycosyltransferase [hydrothermal vent metagenome]|uniref:Glycosyltransferase n=1 Tax=hydrothermal vent metagenome TaxID=652676 RepID=A0A3B0TD77_9ZZZZ
MWRYLDKAKQLFTQQIEEWELARTNYKQLAGVKAREFLFEGFKVKVQFNPGRIISSSAKVDKKSIAGRACFLCAKNRPKEQRGVESGDYEILVNPFPIFPGHFTIPRKKHLPQLIMPYFGDMLELSRGIPGFTVFYNGPECGASAPDHFHFQAVGEEFMPINNEIGVLKKRGGGSILVLGQPCRVVDDGLRKFFVLEGSSKEMLKRQFAHIINAMGKLHPNGGGEPMLNVLSNFNNDAWRVLIFPRGKHRPWQYFEEGGKNILLSPASVDMGGVLITPLEKDFKKISREDIRDIFHQVLLPEDEFNALTRFIQ